MDAQSAVLILIKREQEALAAFFEWAEIGPTSPSGWTAIWCENLPDGLTLVADRIVCLDDDVIHVTMAGESLQFQPESSDPAEVADVLARALEMPENARDIQSALVNSSDVDEFAEHLASLDRLPEIQPGEPDHQVTLHRGDFTSVRMTIRIAGPARLTRLTHDWSLVSEVPEDMGGGHFATLLAGSDSRRSTTLILWRRDGGSGISVLDPENVVYTTEWNTGWCHVEPPTASAERIEALREIFGSRVDTERLAELQVVNTFDGDPLVAMARALRLPAAAIEHLDFGSPDGEWVEKTSGPRAWWEATTSSSTARYPRWVRKVNAVVTAVLAVMCLLFTLVVVAAVVTSGGFLDLGFEEGDGWFALMFAALTLVLGWLTLRRLRELRQP